MLVDVVIPIYGSVEQTRRCIKSVLAGRDAQRQSFGLVLIDDASPGAEINALLHELEGMPGIVILRNPHNLGFVATVNRGMALHPERDVVLLNSDTEVANDWLDRLHAHAYREPGVGTVTPFSNNATICSFPVFCADNAMPPGMTTSSLDKLFARVNAGASVDLPTAVGFCMYIRRACLQVVGVFDEQRFGRGYGEENDFCRRALAAGWRNILAADIFVFHAGGGSFGDEREKLAAQAESTLASLHPDYFDTVREFVRNDPPARLRRAVEIERVRLRGVAPHYDHPMEEADRAACLHVIHDLGGGAERWCSDFCHTDASVTHLVIKPLYIREMAIEGLMLYSGFDAALPLKVWNFYDHYEVTTLHHEEYECALREIVQNYRIGTVLVSSLIGHAFDVLETGLPTFWIGHDYFPLCPALHLHFRDVCHRCDDSRMAECAQSNYDFNFFHGLSVEVRAAIRHRFVRLLADGIVTVVAPTRMMRHHLITVFPETAAANCAHIPHGIDMEGQTLPPADDGNPERLRILVLGQLSFGKGVRLLDAVMNCTHDIAKFHLVGAQEMGELFDDDPDVHVVRSYAPEALPELVAEIRPHVGLLLSICPETYSYTLSELMRMGIPPVATRLGAFAERIIDSETGFLVEPQAEAIAQRLRALDSDRAALSHVRACLAGLPQRSVADMVADYRRLLPAATGRMPRANTMVADNAQGLRWAVQLIAQRKRIRSLELGMEMRAERIRRLQGAVQRVEEEAESARRELVMLHDGLQDCERQLGMITMSRSWRMTAPLRWLRRRFGGAR